MEAAFLFVFICSMVSSFGQDGYPVPPKTHTHLFYIQHSSNHNTFVYDANMKGGVIEANNPLDIYRIVYTEGGKKKPLTLIQEKMAYGMKARQLGRNSFELNLAATKEMKFYLEVNKNGQPRVWLTVNNRKMYLDRMFIKIKDGSSSLNVKTDYVLFTGTDFLTDRPVTEKTVIKG